MFPSTIDNEALKKLPKGAFDGEIHLIETPGGVRKYMPVLMRERLLGFDIEAILKQLRGIRCPQGKAH